MSDSTQKRRSSVAAAIAIVLLLPNINSGIAQPQIENDKENPEIDEMNDDIEKYTNKILSQFYKDTNQGTNRMSKVYDFKRSVWKIFIDLMHDLYPSTAKAVKKLVPQLVQEGFQLVTVDELFFYRGINTVPGKVYASGR